jgi:hypothetical protein
LGGINPPDDPLGGSAGTADWLIWCWAAKDVGPPVLETAPAGARTANNSFVRPVVSKVLHLAEHWRYTITTVPSELTASRGSRPQMFVTSAPVPQVPGPLGRGPALIVAGAVHEPAHGEAHVEIQIAAFAVAP